jgi:hypothetical protein
MRKRKVSVSIERSIYTYVYLNHAADWALEQAKRAEEGRFYNCMSSIILSAFCMEAYLNHIGNKLLPYWDEELSKGLSIQNKLKIICYQLNLTPDYSRRPFQSFRNIVKYRNLLAHAISEKISEKGIQLVRQKERVKYPETWWEKYTNLQSAKRWLIDIECIITEIHKTAGEGDLPFVVFSLGGYQGSLVK